MQYLKYLMVGLLFISSFGLVKAHINPNLNASNSGQNQSETASYRMDCGQATAQIDLEINNVKARLLVGGDIWWNGDDGLYVVPKPIDETALPVSSLFAGAVWLGGFDDGGSLKVAAQTYGTASGSSDFWPGPLTETGDVSDSICEQWDRFFVVSGFNITQHINAWDSLVAANGGNTAGVQLDAGSIPEDILGWPSTGNAFFFDLFEFDLPFNSQGLAPFEDVNFDGLYTPQFGDYPVIDIKGCEEFPPQYGDEMIFWIYNDAGNVHTESNASAIQMEVQVEAFAYQTANEINDMTFYRYKLINRAIEAIDSTFFAMWVDPDLGCFRDDYVGCDTSRSLMYVYNSDALDGLNNCNDCDVASYCTDIPMIGVDYFRGPNGPKKFLVINGDTTLVDPGIGESGDTLVELGMSSFTYYNNGGVNPPPPPGTDDPGSAVEYYNYLSGSWRDGTPFTFGNDAYNPGSPDLIEYAFTDPPNLAGGWSMAQEGLADGDRRTVQASGPFRLDPGAVNELIIGVPWVPDVQHPNPSLDKLLAADDLAQDLFDNCFDINDGPTAPDVCFVELNREIIMTLSNERTSNNFEENYSERCIGCKIPEEIPDEIANYRFEGYKVFQLIAPNVSPAEFDDPERARLIRTVDVRNGVTNIYNWSSSPNPIDPVAGQIWTPTLEVEGPDQGVEHTFRITEDQFGTTDQNLINHKEYYFTVIAYGHNNYENFDTETETGMPRPYIEGRLNIGPDPQTTGYTVIPRPIPYQELNANYGDGPIVTRLDGIGAGSKFLDISDEMREQILKDGSVDEIIYTAGNSPINVKIYNPLDVLDGEFELEFVDENSNGEVDAQDRWRLTNLDDPNFEVISEKTLERVNEETIAEYGFSISLEQPGDAGSAEAIDNGAIGADLIYEDPVGPNWVSSITNNEYSQIPPFTTLQFVDPVATDNLDINGDLTEMSGGLFYPYRLLNFTVTSPLISMAWLDGSNSASFPLNQLSALNNVDIVLTSDPSKWSRCMVVEMGNQFYTDDLGLGTVGGVDQFDLRSDASVGSDDDPFGSGSGTGMSWFPGYAVNVETGKRVNIFFGENSVYDCSTLPNVPGCEDFTTRDMVWNPNSQELLVTQGQFSIYNFYMGGQHAIYVTDQDYDGCESLAEAFGADPITKSLAVSNIKWAGMLAPEAGFEMLSYEDGIIPNDVIFKLRVDNPYQREVATGENNGFNKYRFSFEGVQADVADEPDEVESQLDMINVVPNPYYGFSDYETNTLSNVVKITNLPYNCTVTIFSLNGTFIRQYRRNEARQNRSGEEVPVLQDQVTPALEWDLKNNRAIPVASGVYLIHIEAEGLGERVIKWFGVNRQFDPTGL